MLNLFSQTILVASVLIIVIFFYLKRATASFQQILTEMIKMNELNEYDPVKFVDSLPPLMKKLGVKDYGYYFYYLETEHQKKISAKTGTIKKFVCAQDYTVFAEILPGRLKREKAYLSVLLLETVFLLLKIDVTLNLKATEKALSEFSKINTFLSHDIKNLAQFITIMEHNLNDADTGADKERLFEYLKSTAPSLKLRADRVLSALTESASAYVPGRESVRPYELAKAIADILNVTVECSSKEVSCVLEKKGIIIIIENIVKNFYDKSINESRIRLLLETEKEEGFVTISFTDTGSPLTNPEKVFEPFYSEKKGGLGIGLYHCRNIAHSMQGKMWAENTALGPCFYIKLKEG